MSGDWSVDVELLEAWRAGDVDAGATLYDRHADVVARFFENKVCIGASDLVQQTFLLLVESRDRIRQGLTFRAFVLGIARNVLRDHVRKLARGREVDPEVDAMVDLAPGPTTVIGHSREQRLLLAALRRLPLEHQMGLELYYWEERTPSDPNPATWRAFGGKYTGSQGVRRWLPVLPSAPGCSG